MAYSYTLDLNNTESGQVIIGSAPYTLTFDPTSVAFNRKVYKIVYDFGDGEVYTQKIFAKPRVKDVTLKYPEEIGDPRNYKITRLYQTPKGSPASYQVSVVWYWIRIENLDTNEENFVKKDFVINVIPSGLNANPYDTVGHYFQDMHLASTRMFGADNTILYNFESSNPNYLLPTLVKWQPTPINPIIKALPPNQSPKRFNIQESFDFKNNLNQNIHPL
jgi:hypothetical protein